MFLQGCNFIRLHICISSRKFTESAVLKNDILLAQVGKGLVPKDVIWGGSLDNIKPLILFEDNHLLVLYKPPSILMQGDMNNADNLLNAGKRYLMQQKSKPGDAYLGLVHRIDRTASGVIVFSKTSKSAARISSCFKKREVSKYYLCVVNGHLKHDFGTCNDLLLKTGAKKTAILPMDSPRVDSVAGTLRYKVIRRLSVNPTALQNNEHHEAHEKSNVAHKQTLVAIELETGRKHQIRAQMSHLGHPIVGDVKYGAPQRFKTRDIALHAAILSFPHPISSEKMVFQAHTPFIWQYRFGDEAINGSNQFINYMKKQLTAANSSTIPDEGTIPVRQTFFDLLNDFKVV